MTLDPLEPEWTAALAVRLINLKSHVLVRGSRVTFRFHGKHRALVRTALVDSELAEAMRELLAAKGGRARFRYRNGDGSATSPGDA